MRTIAVSACFMFFAVGLAHAQQNSSSAKNSQSTLTTDRYAPSGEAWAIWRILYLNPDCSPIGHPVIRIQDPPNHGTLSVSKKLEFPTFPANSPFYDCNKTKSENLVIEYTSEPGYFGDDPATILAIIPGGSSSVIHFNIHVN